MNASRESASYWQAPADHGCGAYRTDRLPDRSPLPHRRGTIGLPELGASVAGLGYYVPRLLGAVLVVVVGLVVGHLARDAVTAAAAAPGASFADRTTWLLLPPEALFWEPGPSVSL